MGSTIWIIESSSIREISFAQKGSSRNIVGGHKNSKNLCAFGDICDVGYMAKLQHPIGICSYENHNLLVVADTYNHKIKLVNPETCVIADWFGTGKPGYIGGKFGDAQFNEPSGLSRVGDTIYVADTNNHCIRILDGVSGSVITLGIKDVPVVKVAAIPRVRLTKLQNVNSIEVDQKTVSNKDLYIEFTIILPEGCNITFVKYQLWLDVGSVLQLEDKRSNKNLYRVNQQNSTNGATSS